MRNMLPTSNMIQVTYQSDFTLNTIVDFFVFYCIAEDLSITASILTSIGIHEPSYDDCYIIREVCKTVSLRAANLAAAGSF